MKFSSGTDNMGSVTAHRLTIKDAAGRLETLNDVTIESVYILGDKFYKVTHSDGEILYNPFNIVFLQVR